MIEQFDRAAGREIAAYSAAGILAQFFFSKPATQNRRSTPLHRLCFSRAWHTQRDVQFKR